ncbi:MAG: GxxExxY protein [Caldilinea sp. CFX5]|nr:GxxExxY protein [Caldilinea sp. CFX5]
MVELVYPELSYQVQGAIYDVYNKLRYFDIAEAGWEQALILTLRQRGLVAERQVEYELRYKGFRIGRFFVDVLADGKIILELKVTPSITPIHLAQIISYLKVSGLQLGILVNFGGEKLEFQRIPRTLKQWEKPSKPEPGATIPQDLLYPELTSEIRGALMEVHNALGPGFMPMHYRRATRVEMQLRHLPFVRHKESSIRFCDHPIETKPIQLLVIDEKVLLTIVTVRQVERKHQAQAQHFMEQFALPLGMVANFCKPSLEIKTLQNKA